MLSQHSVQWTGWTEDSEIIRIMKVKIIALTALLTLGLPLAAQDGFSRFVEKISSNVVSFDYAYTLNALKGSGKVRMNGSSYFITGDGLEIRSDGRTTWTTDLEAKEIVVEDAGSQDLTVGLNPALLLANASAIFRLSSESEASISGKKALRLTLKPRTDDSGLSSMTVLLNASDLSLISADIVQDDGKTIKIAVSSFAFTGKDGDTAKYGVELSAYDRSWVVTDLR